MIVAAEYYVWDRLPNPIKGIESEYPLRATPACVVLNPIKGIESAAPHVFSSSFSLTNPIKGIESSAS